MSKIDFAKMFQDFAIVVKDTCNKLNKPDWVVPLVDGTKRLGIVVDRYVYPKGAVQFNKTSYVVVENAGTVTLQVDRVNGQDSVATVKYQTVPGTAVENRDFTPTSGTLTWADQDVTPKTITLGVIDNKLVDASRSFTVKLTSPTGATLGSAAVATVTVTNEDVPVPVVPGRLQFKVSTMTVTEGAGNVKVGVTRTDGLDGAVGVSYRTVDGTAKAGVDYVGLSGVLSWSDKDAIDRTITFTILNDSVAEQQKTFTVELFNPTGGATLGQSVLTVGLLDDDNVLPPSTNNDEFLMGMHDKIPNFGRFPNVYSVKSGNWSDPTVWSTGLVPGDGVKVSISSDNVVVYDVVSDVKVGCVAVQNRGVLKFKTDGDTRLRATHVVVNEGGAVLMGTEAEPVRDTAKCELIINDVALDTVGDPAQYGNGLIVFGKFYTYGKVIPKTWIAIAEDVVKGGTTLKLVDPATGWAVGNRVAIPDTHQLDWWESSPNAPSGYQWEVLTITAISPDLKTITLSAPFAFDHYGNAPFRPHVALLTRNVTVKSENSQGTRGHCIFLNRADVCIKYTQILGMGRTTNDPLDNTTFDANGGVTHVGTNQIGRYPIHFHHLMGPVNATQGYQYVFEGNTVACLMNDFKFKWGMAIHDSHYGLIRNNLIYNWAGAAIAIEDGNESFNVIEGNYLSRVQGTGGRDDGGRDGAGIWSRSLNNYIRNNVASNILGLYAYGYTFANRYANFPQRIPKFPGADMEDASNYNEVNPYAIPFLEVNNNETYGAGYGCMTWWWIGTNFLTPVASAGTIKNVRAWNLRWHACYGYESYGLTIDGMLVRGDTQRLASDNWMGDAIEFGDYFTKDFTLKNFDISGVGTGILVADQASGNFTIQDGLISNCICGISNGITWSVGGADGLPERTVVVKNVRFGPGASNRFGGPSNISLDGRGGNGKNLIVRNDVYVYDYNGVAGDNFKLYFNEQKPDYVLPQSGQLEPGARAQVGSPEAGLTNQQNWDKYHIAHAGSIVPAGYSTRPLLNGLVVPLGAGGGPTKTNLINRSNFEYVGSFRFPNSWGDGDGTGYGGDMVVLNPKTGRLVYSGQGTSLTEFEIPELIKGKALTDLKTANRLTPWFPVKQQLQGTPTDALDGFILGDLIYDEVKDRYVGSGYSYYSGAFSQRVSHFAISSADLTKAQVQGMFELGNPPVGRPGSGYMCKIPAEWQARLGFTHLVGLSGVPIISAAGGGPTAYGFNAADVGTPDAKWQEFLKYGPEDLGEYAGILNPLQSGCAGQFAMFWVPGTDSVLFFGYNGTNYSGYGEPTDFDDTSDGGKGPHSLYGEYGLTVWAYDANDFLAVKNGTKKSYQIMPYAVWGIEEFAPFVHPHKYIGAVTYDAAKNILYTVMLGADIDFPSRSYQPVVNAIRINLPKATDVVKPTIGSLAVTPNPVKPGPVPAGTPLTLTAGNVYGKPGVEIVEVSFYTDAGVKLGVGTRTTVKNGDHHWNMTVPSTGLASGVNYFKAVAKDATGLLSDEVKAKILMA